MHIHSSWADRLSTEKHVLIIQFMCFLMDLQSGLVGRAYLQKCFTFEHHNVNKKREKD